MVNGLSNQSRNSTEFSKSDRRRSKNSGRKSPYLPQNPHQTARQATNQRLTAANRHSSTTEKRWIEKRSANATTEPPSQSSRRNRTKRNNTPSRVSGT